LDQVISWLQKEIRRGHVDGAAYAAYDLAELVFDRKTGKASSFWNYALRRLAVCAAEDIGMANPMALVVANATWAQAERRHRLGQAVPPELVVRLAVFLSQQPKSRESDDLVGVCIALRKERTDWQALSVAQKVQVMLEAVRCGDEVEAAYWAWSLQVDKSLDASGKETSHWQEAMVALQQMAYTELPTSEWATQLIVEAAFALCERCAKSGKPVDGNWPNLAVMCLTRAHQRLTANSDFAAVYRRVLETRQIEADTEQLVPVPAYAIDRHTEAGKALLRGEAVIRGLSYEQVANEKFFGEGALLFPWENVPSNRQYYDQVCSFLGVPHPAAGYAVPGEAQTEVQAPLL
jgi:hypothetical protein